MIVAGLLHDRVVAHRFAVRRLRQHERRNDVRGNHDRRHEDQTGDGHTAHHPDLDAEVAGNTRTDARDLLATFVLIQARGAITRGARGRLPARLAAPTASLPARLAITFAACPLRIAAVLSVDALA